MSNQVQKEAINKVIATNIGCMKSLLEKALTTVIDADQAADKGERNLAIGCLMEIEAAIANTKALYDATIFMHRHG